MYYVVDPYWTHYLACIAMIRVSAVAEKPFWLAKAISIRFDIPFGDEPEAYMIERVLSDLHTARSLMN
jgi:hypothetical protein